MYKGQDLVQHAIENEREAIDTLLEREDGIQQAEIRECVQKSTTRDVNVFREGPAPKDTLRNVHGARELYQQTFVGDKLRTFSTDLLQTLEMHNILDITEAITLGTLARNESRGAHWRKEYQKRRDEEWLKHTMLSWNDGHPELWYKSVTLEGENKTYGLKMRSY